MRGEEWARAALGIEGELVTPKHSVRLGVVGCGSHTFRNVLPVLRHIPEARLVATCDLNREKAEAYAQAFGAERATGDHRELVGSGDLDAVLLILGFDEQGQPLYPSVARNFLERDVCVWMEKPPSSTRGQLASLRPLVDGPTFLQVGFKRMFAPGWTHAAQILREPEFGPITSYSFRYSVDLPAEPGNLMRPSSRRFLDDIVHVASSIVHLVGVPKSATPFRGVGGDGFVVLQHGSGAVGSIHLSKNASRLDAIDDIVLTGIDTSLRIRNSATIEYFPSGWRGSYGRSTSWLPAESDGVTPRPTDGPRRWEPQFSIGSLASGRLFHQGYYEQLRHFVDCVRKGVGPTRAHLEDALRVMAIVDAIRPPFGTTVSVEGSDGDLESPIPVADDEEQPPICPRTGEPFDLKDGWSYRCRRCGITSPVGTHGAPHCP